MKSHPDFNLPWIQTILNDPKTEFPAEFPSLMANTSNSIFNITLEHPNRIKARLLFLRPSTESEAIFKSEDCLLASLGEGLDGATGRAHGGISSLLLDHILGTCAQRQITTLLPAATATLTVDYKNPIGTPGVILVRAWVIKIDGRKVWSKGVIEDGKGKIFATAKGLFIIPRPGASL